MTMKVFRIFVNSSSFHLKRFSNKKYFGTSSFSPNSATSELIKNVDISTDEQTKNIIKPHSNSKINRGLTQSDSDSRLSSRNQGALLAIESDIEEVVQSFMTKNGFAFVAGRKSGTTNTSAESPTSIDSNILEVESVTLTPDGSLITVYWWSPVVENFCDFLAQSKSLVEVNKVRERATTKIGRKLQMKEGAFRTAITQQINFKRVPKLTFIAYEGKKTQ